jgi:hypothetical protein
LQSPHLLYAFSPSFARLWQFAHSSLSKFGCSPSIILLKESGQQEQENLTPTMMKGISCVPLPSIFAAEFFRNPREPACPRARCLRRTDEERTLLYFVCLWCFARKRGVPVRPSKLWRHSPVCARQRGARTDILRHESRAKASVGSHCKPVYQHGVPLHFRFPRGDIRRNQLLSWGGQGSSSARYCFSTPGESPEMISNKNRPFAPHDRSLLLGTLRRERSGQAVTSVTCDRRP